MKELKRLVFSWIQNSRLYPHIFFVPSPFKIYEFRELLGAARIEPTDVLLDIGCGAGMQTCLLARQAARVVGIDVSQDVINRAKSELHEMAKRGNVEFICASLEGAGFAAGSFDKIYSVCVLEHIENDAEVMQEAFRVLRPGGCLVMSIDSLDTISDAALKERHREAFWVRRYYTPESIISLLQHAGFTRVRVTPILCSELAAALFSEGIRRAFSYRYTEAVRFHWRLCREEKRTPDREHGIYLIVRAEKAA